MCEEVISLNVTKYQISSRPFYIVHGNVNLHLELTLPLLRQRLLSKLLQLEMPTS